MSWMEVAVLALTIVGFAVTAFGLWRIYADARREAVAARERLVALPELAQQQRQDIEQLQERMLHEGADPALVDQATTERARHWDGVYAQRGLVRPTYGNMTELAAHESERLLRLVLEATRTDVLIALFGLLLSTAGSVWSLFV